MAIFTILYVAIGLLLIVAALPLILRRIKPNGLYGLRVPATLADQRVWYEANARSGLDLLVVGVVQVVVALLLPLVAGVSVVAYATTNAAVLLGGALGTAAIGWRRANRLLAEREAGSEDYEATQK
jgi:uncharacterized membrane protein